MSLSVVTVPAPAPGGTVSPLVAEFAAVQQRHCVETFGNDDLADSADSLGVAYSEQGTRRKLIAVALEGDVVVGGCFFGLPLKDNRTLAEGDFAVVPGADTAEVMTTLWEEARPQLRAAGRRTVQVWMSHRIGSAAQEVTPRTGVGRLPRDAVAVTLQGLGFELEQVERHSVLEVATSRSSVAAAAVRAREAAGASYETFGWVGSTPETLREEMAAIMARMSTDVPVGELQLEPEVWDAARVAEADRVAERVGRRRLTTVARPVGSGQIVAYTQLDVPGDKPQVAYQEDTLVHAGHRGHRLGLLVKALNLEQLARECPEVERVHTWNAGENEHMLAINHALGFSDHTVEGGWQLTGL